MTDVIGSEDGLGVECLSGLPSPPPLLLGRKIFNLPSFSIDYL